MDGHVDPAVAAVIVGDVKRLNRQIALASLAAVLSILVIARLLPPDPRGYGTHERLLLPPCTFRLVTHLPCPFCGMTTGFAHMARGEIVPALQSNPGAPLFYAFTWLLFAASLQALIRGTRVLPVWATGSAALRVFLLVTALLWVAHIGYVRVAGQGY